MKVTLLTLCVSYLPPLASLLTFAFFFFFFFVLFSVYFFFFFFLPCFFWSKGKSERKSHSWNQCRLAKGKSHTHTHTNTHRVKVTENSQTEIQTRVFFHPCFFPLKTSHKNCFSCGEGLAFPGCVHKNTLMKSIHSLRDVDT